MPVRLDNTARDGTAGQAAARKARRVMQALAAPPRSLAIVLGALGDFVLALPLLCALRQRGPLALFTRGGYRALLPAVLADGPFVDTEGPAGALLFAGEAPLPPALRSLLAGASVHAFLRPDAVLDSCCREAGALGVVWHPPRPASPPHLVVRFFTEAGIEPPPGLLETPVMPRPDTTDRALWLHPGSGSPAKNIPIPQLADLAARWRERSGESLIVSFGEADLALREPVRAAFATRSLPYAEVVCPSLAELRRRLEADAAAFIGPDTGVTHLAAALGVPVTVVFRTTDPAIWSPVGRVTIVRAV